MVSLSLSVPFSVPSYGPSLYKETASGHYTGPLFVSFFRLGKGGWVMVSLSLSLYLSPYTVKVRVVGW